MTTFSLDGLADGELDAPTVISDEGKGTCPDCGRSITINADGTLRAHKCGDQMSKGAKSRTSTKRAKGKATKDAPANVLRVGSAALAAGTEWTAKRVVGSYVPCPPSLVPADIDDAGELFEPLIKLLWPNVPARAQSVVSAICDQEDLIACLLAWIAYFAKLKAFAEQAHQIVQAEEKRKREETARLSQGLGVKDNVNGIQTAPSEVVIGGLTFAGVEPFTPGE